MILNPNQLLQRYARPAGRGSAWRPAAAWCAARIYPSRQPKPAAQRESQASRAGQPHARDHLELPAILGLLVLFLTAGAILVYLALNSRSSPKRSHDDADDHA